MLVVGIIPESGEQEKRYIVQATEKELDKVSGIAEVEHIEGRIKVGHEILVSDVYNNLDYFVRHRKRLKNAVTSLRDAATTINNLLPKE